MTAAAASRGPSRVGRFELRRELGRGAQATVWLGYDPRLEREVAVKVIDPGADADAVARWLDEARAVSRLAHPNIVPVFEADEDGGVPFMVFEYVTGPTLTELLRQHGKLPSRDAAELIRDVLDAIATAHEQGIVHRDLKPSNILMDAQGRPRVMDFGIAARVSDAHDGRVVGTPGYISPEAVGGAPAHPLMDVFAAGMMLGRMVCGRPMMEVRDPQRALERLLREDIAWPGEAGGETVDDALRGLVMRAVSRDPALRPESAAAFRDALAEWLDPSPIDGGGDRAVLEFLLRRMSRRPDFPALSGAVERVQRLARAENAGLALIADALGGDVALAHKLLRQANSADFRGAGRGDIATVPRAVSVLGLAGVRSLSSAMPLLEHMQDRAHAQHLREAFVLSMLTARIAGELAQAHLRDEAFLAGLTTQLGRLLVEFYFPDEASDIRARVAPAWLRGEGAEGIEKRAVADVLGISHEQLALGVTKVWGLPDTLRRAAMRPGGDPPSRAVVRPIDHMRWCVVAANELAQVLMREPGASLAAKIVAVGRRFGGALSLTGERFAATVRSAQTHLQALSREFALDAKAGGRAVPASGGGARPSTMSGTGEVRTGGAGSAQLRPSQVRPSQVGSAEVRTGLGATPTLDIASDALTLVVHPDAARRALQGAGISAGGTARATAPPADGSTERPTVVLSAPAAQASGIGGHAGVAASTDAVANAVANANANATSEARRLKLEQGVARVARLLASDGFRRNEVLRDILSTLHVAFDFRCVVFGLRDKASRLVTGRLGLGQAGPGLSARFMVDPGAEPRRDLMAEACARPSCTRVADVRADDVRGRLPAWLLGDETIGGFVVLPMTMKATPFGLIYADWAAPGGGAIAERDLGWLETLRDQAIMAFKTAG